MEWGFVLSDTDIQISCFIKKFQTLRHNSNTENHFYTCNFVLSIACSWCLLHLTQLIYMNYRYVRSNYKTQSCLVLANYFILIITLSLPVLCCTWRSKMDFILNLSLLVQGTHKYWTIFNKKKQLWKKPYFGLFS